MSKAAANTQTAILERVVQPGRHGWSEAVAEVILELKFPPGDVRRMERLLDRAKAGTLTPDEEVELENYRNVGRLLEMMKSRARRALGKAA